MSQAAVAKPPVPAPVQPIRIDQMEPASFGIGEIMVIKLEGDEVVEEGPQDVRRWQNIAPKLIDDQLLIIKNGGGGFWTMMRVEQISGGKGLGVRGITLRHCRFPDIQDKHEEPIVANGTFYVRKVNGVESVIAPNGSVRSQHRTQVEAQLVCESYTRNPGARR